MEQGWIKLHRTIINHWIWQDSLKLKWWIDLLLMANHKENKLFLGNVVIEVSRGSIHTSVTKLAARWKVDKKTVRKFLKLLETESMISYSTSSKGATITLCNYNEYQDFKPMEVERTLSQDSKGDLSTAPPIESTKSLQPPHPSPIVYDWKVDNVMDSGVDNTMDTPLDTNIDNTMNSITDTSMDNTVDNTMDNSLHSTRDNTVDTNNNVNNAKNLKNAKEGREGKEAKQNQNSLKSLPALSFSTQEHRKIFNSLGEVAYRTWFMDAAIEATPKVATLKVDSDFKKNIINSKFRIQLGQILGKPVDVVLS